MKKITLFIISFIFLFNQKGTCSTVDTLVVVDFGIPSSSFQINTTGYYINGEVKDYGMWTSTPSIHIAIIDSISCDVVSNCNRFFGQFNIFDDPDGDCIMDPNTIYTTRSRPENFFIYRDNDAASVQSMAHLLDSVDNGHIIIAYSVFPYAFSTMDTSFRNVFQRLGSALIPTMPDTVPFIFVCRKGDAGSVHENVGLYSGDSIGVSMTYQCSPTGIAEITTGDFNVYPNPVSDKLHIDFKNGFMQGQIKIYDAMGSLITELRNSYEHMVINTDDFPQGVYFIKFESGNHSSVQRFFKCEFQE